MCKSETKKLNAKLEINMIETLNPKLEILNKPKTKNFKPKTFYFVFENLYFGFI